MVNGTVYALSNATGFGVLLGSAIVAVNPVTNQSMVAAVGGTPHAPRYPMLACPQGTSFLVANSPAGIQNKVLNNTASPSTEHYGNLTLINQLNYTTHAVNYTNLPSGFYNVELQGFAGTTSLYMFVLIDGAVMVSSPQGFIPATTIMNNTAESSLPDTIGGITSTNGSFLVNAQAQPNGSGNLYFSSNAGIIWTQISLADIPVASGQGPLSGVSSVIGFDGSSYYIETTDGVATALYQTATPANIATWLAITALPIQESSSYINGNLYSFSNNSTTVGLYNMQTGQFNFTQNSLPENYISATVGWGDTSLLGQNLAWNGKEYALVGSAGTAFWSGSSLTGESAAWTESNVIFSGINNVVLSDTFTGFPPLLWTGKVWLSAGSSLNIYSSITGSAWQAATYIDAKTGNTLYINNGFIPKLF